MCKALSEKLVRGMGWCFRALRDLPGRKDHSFRLFRMRKPCLGCRNLEGRCIVTLALCWIHGRVENGVSGLECGGREVRSEPLISSMSWDDGNWTVYMSELSVGM